MTIETHLRPLAEKAHLVTGLGLDEQAAYIAALSPSRVLRLLDVVEAARKWAAPVDHLKIMADDPDHFCDFHECDGISNHRAEVAAALRTALWCLDEGEKP